MSGRRRERAYYPKALVAEWERTENAALLEDEMLRWTLWVIFGSLTDERTDPQERSDQGG